MADENQIEPTLSPKQDGPSSEKGPRNHGIWFQNSQVNVNNQFTQNNYFGEGAKPEKEEEKEAPAPERQKPQAPVWKDHGLHGISADHHDPSLGAKIATQVHHASSAIRDNVHAAARHAGDLFKFHSMGGSSPESAEAKPQAPDREPSREAAASSERKESPSQPKTPEKGEQSAESGISGQVDRATREMGRELDKAGHAASNQAGRAVGVPAEAAPDLTPELQEAGVEVSKKKFAGDDRTRQAGETVAERNPMMIIGGGQERMEAGKLRFDPSPFQTGAEPRAEYPVASFAESRKENAPSIRPPSLSLPKIASGSERGTGVQAADAWEENRRDGLVAQRASEITPAPTQGRENIAEMGAVLGL